MPTSCFITFEEEDGKVLAENTNTSKDLLNAPMRFKEASEPTDIIWENRHFTFKDYMCRGLIAGIIILILLGGSFCVIYIVSATSERASAVFPASINCDLVDKTYGDELQKYAIKDYEFITNNKDKQSSGTLKCYCD